MTYRMSEYGLLWRPGSNYTTTGGVHSLDYLIRDGSTGCPVCENLEPDESDIVPR